MFFATMKFVPNFAGPRLWFRSFIRCGVASQFITLIRHLESIWELNLQVLFAMDEEMRQCTVLK